jgi:tetratricopeptide (TPR) repeat protein
MTDRIVKLMASAILTTGLLFVFSISAHAQFRILKIVVTDEKNRALEDASVKIEGMDIYYESEGKTDKRGMYTQLIPNYLAGYYRVVVRKDGFAPDFKDELQPFISEELGVFFQLKPGDSQAELQKRLADQEKRQKFSAEVRLRFDQGVRLFDERQYNDALAEFNAALAIDPKQPAILARTGDCYARLNRNEEALDAYDKAIELDPGNASLYAQKGVVLSNLGKMAESQEMFRRSAGIDPKGAARNVYNLGATLVNAGEMTQAAEAFRQSIAADPNYAESYYNLGMSLANDEEMFPAAIDAFKKYAEIGKMADQIKIAKDMITALGGS